MHKLLIVFTILISSCFISSTSFATEVHSCGELEYKIEEEKTFFEELRFNIQRMKNEFMEAIYCLTANDPDCFRRFTGAQISTQMNEYEAKLEQKVRIQKQIELLEKKFEKSCSLEE